MSILYPDLGNVCVAPGCGVYDMLPFKCEACGAMTCGEHRRAPDHDCPAIAASAEEEEVVACARCGLKIRLQGEGVAEHDCPGRGVRCSVPGCRVVVTVCCRECSQGFCVEHRHPEAHNCALLLPPAPLPVAQERMGAQLSQEELHLPFPRWTFRNTPEGIEGVSSVPPARRLGLRVFFSPELNRRPLYFCADASWTVGKTLDALCTSGDVPNRNNRDPDPSSHLFLSLLWGPCPLLPSPIRLSSLQTAGFPAFRCGVGVIVHRGPTLPPSIVRCVPRWLLSLHLKWLTGSNFKPAFSAGSWLDRLDRTTPAASAVRFIRALPVGPVLLVMYVAFLILLGFLDVQ